jgi:Flp pilus assembly protein TadG
MHRLHRVRLRADRRAATAVEFALVCAPFTIFLLAVMGVGLQYYLQQALDYATQEAVRQVQLGHVAAGDTEADFVNNVFCPLFGQFQNCANLFIDLHPVTDYQQLTNPGVPDAPNNTATTGFVFCPGTAGQLMYAHIVYLAPSIGGTLFGSAAAGSNAIVANAAFAVENPTGVAVVPANGC